MLRIMIVSLAKWKYAITLHYRRVNYVYLTKPTEAIFIRHGLKFLIYFPLLKGNKFS